MNQSRLLYLIIAGISIFAAAYIVMKYVLVKKPGKKTEKGKVLTDEFLPQPVTEAPKSYFSSGFDIGNELTNEDLEEGNVMGSDDEDEDEDGEEEEEEEDGEQQEEEEEEMITTNNLSQYLSAPSVPVTPVQPSPPAPPSTKSELLPIGDERFPELNELCFPAIATPAIPYHTNPNSMYSMFSNKADTTMPSIYNIV